MLTCRRTIGDFEVAYNLPPPLLNSPYSDGPCSIRFSRLKTLDACSGTPSPAEIVERHNQLVIKSLVSFPM